MAKDTIHFDERDMLIPEPPEGWWKLDEKDRNEIYDYIHDIGEKYYGFMNAYRQRMEEIIFRVRLFCIIMLVVFWVFVFCVLY